MGREKLPENVYELSYSSFNFEKNTILQVKDLLCEKLGAYLKCDVEPVDEQQTQLTIYTNEKFYKVYDKLATFFRDIPRKGSMEWVAFHLSVVSFSDDWSSRLPKGK